MNQGKESSTQPDDRPAAARVQRDPATGGGDPQTPVLTTQVTLPEEEEGIGPQAPTADLEFDQKKGITTLFDEAEARATEGRLPRRLIGQRFEPLMKLGAGAMGEVYFVRDHQIPDRQLALKIINSRLSLQQKFRELFLQEIRSAQAFVSEYVNQVRDTGKTEEGLLYLTMDYVRGESLRGLLKRENSLHERHALEIARQALLGLQSGHEKGLIHRDVKPENVMLAARVPKTEDNPYGVGVRLPDFGLAGLAQEVGGKGIAGTPMYMSPEQAQGQKLDARSDLFAVGVILYEMISGTRPFHGKTVEKIITSVIETDVRPLIEELDQLSKPVQKILRRVLEKKREDRFQSASEFIDAIEQSKAYKAPRVLPAWASGLMALLFITTAGGVAMSVKLNEERIKLLGESQTLLGRNQDLVQENAELRDSRQGKKIESVARESQEDNLTEKVARLEREGESARTEREEAKKESHELKKQVAMLDEDRTEKQRLIDDLQQKIKGQEARLDPVFRAAQGMDAILLRLEEGLGDEAHKRLDELSGEEVFLKRALPGKEFLESLTSSASALKSLRRRSVQDPDRASDFEEASARLADARALREDFATLAQEWIDLPIDNEREPQRLSRVDRVMHALDLEIRRIAESMASDHESDWSQISGRPTLEACTAAVEHLHRFRCDHASLFTQRMAIELEPKLIHDGVWNPGAVPECRSLIPWAEFLLTDKKSLEFPSARDLVHMSFAMRWYDDSTANDELPWTALREGDSEAFFSEAHPRWLHAVRMQHELSQAASAFPNRGRLLVYRGELLGSGSVFFEIENFIRKEKLEEAIVWEIMKEVRDKEGLRQGIPEKRRIRLTGRIFRDEREVRSTLDLCQSDKVRVEVFRSGQETRLPGSLAISAADLERFRESLKRESLHCLVVESTGGIRWFSPVFGLMREVTLHPETREETIKKELVFTSDS